MFIIKLLRSYLSILRQNIILAHRVAPFRYCYSCFSYDENTFDNTFSHIAASDVIYHRDVINDAVYVTADVIPTISR